MLVAWLVLVGLLVTLLICGYRVWVNWGTSSTLTSAGKVAAKWPVAVLLVLGLFISSYLSQKYLTDTAVACGPLGDCDLVQHSRFAWMLGVPVAVWGVLGYSLLFGLWALGVWWAPARLEKNGSDRWATRIRPALLLGCLFALTFSIYLTSLEVFILKAICSWCMGSAVVTALLCWSICWDQAWLPKAPQLLD
jgi:uncharacterized membrane protein